MRLAGDRLVNIGDAKSLATHPASQHHHRQLNDEERAKASVKVGHGAPVGGIEARYSGDIQALAAT